VERNISGHITKIDGVAFRTLVDFANRYNFTYVVNRGKMDLNVIILVSLSVGRRYSILQVNDTRLEKQSKALPGLAYYLQNGVKFI
jgi:hypothetical protein